MTSSTPRTVDAIIDSIGSNAADVNPAADLRKGPLGVLQWAIANELSRSENFSSYTQTIHQFENASLIERQDLISLGRNYGKNPDVGRASRTLVHLYRNSRPLQGKTYPAPAGTVVASKDGRFQFVTLNSLLMDGNYADIYFSPNDRWYEIPVMVEATAVGSDYDLPPYTITRLMTSLEDFDGCVNKTDVHRRGSDPIDALQFIRLLQNTMQGIGTDLAGNAVGILQDVDPTGYDDIAFVPSTDFSRFVRGKSLHGKLGYDFYVITDSVEETIQDGVAQGGEIIINLTYKPALAVSYVSVNGVPVAFSFEQDQNPQWKGSPISNDRVRLLTPLLPMQTYQISYVYYDFVYMGHQSFQGRAKPFQTNVVVRLANPVEIYISGEAVIQSSADRSQVISDLRNFTMRYLRNPDRPASNQRTFVTSLDPVDYVRVAQSSVSGLNNLKLSGFIRLDRAYLPIERIVLDGATEYPLLSANFDIV